MTAEQLAELFHTTYETLAPEFGYETRKERAKPWADVPEQNRQLMIAVAGVILHKIEEKRPQPHFYDAKRPSEVQSGDVIRHYGQEYTVKSGSEGFYGYTFTVESRDDELPLCRYRREDMVLVRRKETL